MGAAFLPLVLFIFAATYPACSFGGELTRTAFEVPLLNASISVSASGHGLADVAVGEINCFHLNFYDAVWRAELRSRHASTVRVHVRVDASSREGCYVIQKPGLYRLAVYGAASHPGPLLCEFAVTALLADSRGTDRACSPTILQRTQNLYGSWEGTALPDPVTVTALLPPDRCSSLQAPSTAPPPATYDTWRPPMRFPV